MDDKERLIRQRLKDDFEHYAMRCLKIRLKTAKLNTTTQRLETVAPFCLNKAQRYIHERLEEQLGKTGKVRALILKGRQQGCSTYVEGRFFWKVTHLNGVRAYILTHEDNATKNLFEMAQRYYENCPLLVRPEKHASNAKELEFGSLDSGYRVGTAGNKGAGRSGTIQYFHGSEVAYWPNAHEHAAGALQTVAEQSGTEIILESTANGLGNFFHEQWQKAETQQSDYIAVFVPWFWQEEYRKELPVEFRLSDEECDYKDAYGLTLEQMAWRRTKIDELGEWKFKQEYPATAAEAFQTSGDDVFIKPEIVMRARKGKADASGVKIIGVDPARFGDDRTSIVLRHGRVIPWIKSYSKKDTMEIVGICARLIIDESPDKMFIDIGGLGAGIYDRLKEMGYGTIVSAVNFGEKALQSEKYFNHRAEMWALLLEWLKSHPVQIPDIDTLQADLTGLLYSFDSNGRLKLEKKEDMKKRGLRSPDEGDACALTFAFPVRQQSHRTQESGSHSSESWLAA